MYHGYKNGVICNIISIPHHAHRHVPLLQAPLSRPNGRWSEAPRTQGSLYLLLVGSLTYFGDFLPVATDADRDARSWKAHQARHARHQCQCGLTPETESCLFTAGLWLRFSGRIYAGHDDKVIQLRVTREYEAACRYFLGQVLYDPGDTGRPLDFSAHYIGAHVGPVPWPVPAPPTAPNAALLDQAGLIWNSRMAGATTELNVSAPPLPVSLTPAVQPLVTNAPHPVPAFLFPAAPPPRLARFVARIISYPHRPLSSTNFP
ncbi:hypothetical protein NMY22_g17371 [Coprinellus aureogranulatus]|nr:hypothetical protein NMY22_g17371 [Coprinellus aureogranulatus]